ncbi:MAG: hypothetical protein JJ850_17170 [Kordiimonadaceae bacterium]|nr:hypothetical protein [Kordiimonadaceae bacterium]MBO6570525.1 hypothetical protein [Kordiimonadaceae bacterium]MBO6966356.1 hypothetical protein [Kordiimonadaceae bacterium]
MIKQDVAGRKFAAFGKTRAKNIKILLGLLASTVVLSYLYYRSELGSSDPSTPNLLIYAVIGSLLAIGKVLYEIHLDMPFLHFTEDQFYFDEDGKETKHYWREVEDIREIQLMDRGMPRQDKVVAIVKSKGEQVTIDPRVVRFDGADVEAIARQFWQAAIAKISSK